MLGGGFIDRSHTSG